MRMPSGGTLGYTYKLQEKEKERESKGAFEDCGTLLPPNSVVVNKSNSLV